MTISAKTLFLAPLLILLACSEDPDDDVNPFREDVARCEDAIAHATSCCRGVVAAPSDACVYIHYVESCGGGCESPHGSPSTEDSWTVLTIAESTAIENQTCAQIDCDDVQARVTRNHVSKFEGSLDCY